MAVWNSQYISSAVFMDVSSVTNSLLHLSRSSFNTCMLALWYMYILRGFYLDDPRLAANYDYWDPVMIAYSWYGCRFFNKGGVSCEEQVQYVV